MRFRKQNTLFTLIQEITSMDKNKGNEFKQYLKNELLDYGKRMKCEQTVKKRDRATNVKKISIFTSAYFPHSPIRG